MVRGPYPPIGARVYAIVSLCNVFGPIRFGHNLIGLDR